MCAIFSSDPAYNDPELHTIDVSPSVFARQRQRYTTAGNCDPTALSCGVIVFAHWRTAPKDARPGPCLHPRPLLYLLIFRRHFHSLSSRLHLDHRRNTPANESTTSPPSRPPISFSGSFTLLDFGQRRSRTGCSYVAPVRRFNTFVSVISLVTDNFSTFFLTFDALMHAPTRSGLHYHWT